MSIASNEHGKSDQAVVSYGELSYPEESIKEATEEKTEKETESFNGATPEETTDQAAVRDFFSSIGASCNQLKHSLSPEGRKRTARIASVSGGIVLLVTGVWVGRSATETSKETSTEGNANSNTTAQIEENARSEETDDLEGLSGNESDSNEVKDSAENETDKQGKVYISSLDQLTESEEEDFTEVSLEAEQSIYRKIREGDNPSEETDYRDRNFEFWRGIIVQTTENDNGETVSLRMDNPIVVEVENRIYFVAYHQDSGELLTIDVGEYNAEEDRYYFKDGYENLNSFTREDDPWSGQFATFNPESFDSQGLQGIDNYANILRDDDENIQASAEIIRDADIAYAQTGELLYLEEDTADRIYRDRKQIDEEYNVDTPIID